MRKTKARMTSQVLAAALSLVMMTALLGNAPIVAFADDSYQLSGEEQASLPYPGIDSPGLFALVVLTSTDDCTFILPTSSYLNGTADYKQYDWSINWGDGSQQVESGTSSLGGGIDHVYARPGTYTVIIQAHGPSEAWLAAFGFHGGNTNANAQANKDMVIALLTPFRPEMTRTAEQIAGTSTPPDFEWEEAFVECTNLAQTSGFKGWDSVSSIGNDFAAYMFYQCVSLAFLSNDFNLPQAVSSVGSTFLSSMFNQCVSLSGFPDGFNLPQGIASAPNDFASSMFYNCSSLKGLPAGFNLPQGLSSVGANFAESIFANCSSLTSLPNGFTFPQGIQTVGDYFARFTFYGCTNLIRLPDQFNFPQAITRVYNDFGYGMFYACRSLEGLPAGFNFPAGISAIGISFANRMFYECSSLTRLPDGFTFPQGITAANNSFAVLMFYYCRSLSYLPTGFNLPQSIISVGTSFAERLFLDAGSNSFQINQDFCLPAGLANTGVNVLYQSFYLSDLAPIQNRAAALIIGSCLTPTTNRFTFDGHFRDIYYVPLNWGGSGMALPDTGAPGSGDLNGDGVVTMDEVVVCLQSTTSPIALSAGQYAAIDMDFDGVLTMSDVIMVLQRTI
ncbi:MAG: leucine-rich repeat protein [Coriobacteriia bacterium]|nr:leucine-rich repeat protein [Coriobacteriia bacterium]